MKVRVIALGSRMARDDGAALAVGEALRGARDADPALEVVLAGRPGPGLLDLLEEGTPTLLLDAVRHGAAPGQLVRIPRERLTRATFDGRPVSSHGMGVAEALRLAEALARPLPRGIFLGIGGRRFDPGEQPSPEVEAGMADFVEAARAAVAELGHPRPSREA